MTYRAILFLLVILTLTGCKTKHRIIYSISPVEDKTNDALFRDILDESFPYQTISSRLDLTLTSGNRSYSSKGNIIIIKDNALQVSLQPLFGVEMFRLYVDPDTIVLLDRMNKRYIKEAIATLKVHYPVGFDYYTLQSLFTNRLFVSNKSEVVPIDYRRFSYTRASDRDYYLSSKDPESKIEYSFTINGDDRITFTHLMQPEKKYSLQWSYNDFVVMNESLFPHRMSASITSDDRRINTEFLFSNIVLNQSLELAVQVPASYTKTSVDEIMDIIIPDK